MKVIPIQSGAAFKINKGQYLKVIDIKGSQVSDMVFFNAHDTKEKFSSNKTMDFEESILLTKGNFLWSNFGRKMMFIEEDTNGRNDILLAPCSQETFDIMYDNAGNDHPSCQNNLNINLAAFTILPHEVPSAFNLFMNVQFDEEGKLSVHKPLSKAGDFVILKALEDLIIGLTACSAPDSNGGSFKEIGFEIKI